MAKRLWRLAGFLALAFMIESPAWAQSAPAGAKGLDTGASGGQTWADETLANGLRVIYAPMPSSPATHVRVFYHVGSRDERSDRQGFAHMFEHMMFRGSAHVAPQEHMKLIGLVGGYSNAYTSFDQTVYHETLPSSYTEMALWLEADRMSSFKVSQPIFVTERQVVGEEYRMRANQPYGTLFDQLMPEIFKVHPYHWTPIGNMAHLAAAQVSDLQYFFNKYYVPNNAILVIAGNIDIEKTRTMVQKYFGWIPARGVSTSDGGIVTWHGVERNIPPEPPQTEARRLEVKMPAPLARVVLAYRMPRADSDDIDALNLLLSVLGDGRSSRLYEALVTNDNPSCASADGFGETLEDGGVMGAMATLLGGKKTEDVEKIMREEIAKLRDKPVTAEELEKVKQQSRLALAQRFETAEDVGTELGGTMFTYGNLTRVTTARQRLEAITPADLQRVAKKYLNDPQSTAMIITPGTPPTLPAATQPAAASTPATQPEPKPAVIVFPKDYPTTPPMSGNLPAAVFEKGIATTVPLKNNAPAAQTIVMEEHRMPIINWSLTIRAGSHSEPAGKEGLASLTAGMVRRGPKGKTFDQFNEELESRAISLEVSDDGDVTRISGSCLKEQFPFAIEATKQMLLQPAFDSGEFDRLKNQSLNSLQLALNNPTTLASRELTQDLYGNSPLGRLTTLQSLGSITLDDVKAFYDSIYRADGAIVMISGDTTVADGQRVGADLLAGMQTGNLPVPSYAAIPNPTDANARVILIDKPESKQSSIRMGVGAYSIRSDEKFAGTLTSQILSNGIESRLGQYVRAEKGYVYGVSGIFSPNCHAGAFVGQTDTRFETTADTITAMYKVFDDLKSKLVPEDELADAKFRVTGQLLMSMQTITDQAARRVEGILNDYPIDYYDKYGQRISQITPAQIKDLMNKYVHENQMTVVVVGPAATLKEQLEKIGSVEVKSAVK